MEKKMLVNLPKCKELNSKKKRRKDMKKTISIITLLLFILIIATVLVACDNKFTAGDYNIAIVFMKNGARTYEIESWAFVDSSPCRLIQLNLTSGGIMLVDSENCILYKGDIREIPNY